MQTATPHAPVRALVLGGGGFIGANVVDALREAGHHVATTYRGRAPAFYLRGRVAESVRADLGDRAALRDAMRGRDVVFHAAGHYPRYSLDPEATVETALREMCNVLDAAREAGVRRVVYTSSIATVEGDGGIAPRAPEGSIYRAAKWHMERAALDALRDGLDVVTLRPGGCLGPWDMRVGTGGIVVAVIRAALPWRVDGIVYVVDVRDVARAHVAALGEDVRGSYDLAGHAVPVGALLERVASRYGGAAPTEVLGPDAARARAEAEEHAAAKTRARAPLPREFVDIALAEVAASDARARRELGFDPRPLDDALDAAVAWFRRTGHLPAQPNTESSPS